jgi:hypothetical protein
MKKIISILTFILFCSILSQAQAQFWEEDYTFEALADQADGGSVSVDITNTGLDIEECKKKARSQALFTIIFKGYPKTNNASSSTPLADMGNFNQNLDFYKNYLTSNTAGLAFINNYQTNMSKPGGKIDKKTIRTTTTVYIMKGKLKADLQAQGMIKSAKNMAESMGIEPTILIVPSNLWMEKAGYSKVEQTDAGPITKYDYQSALKDPNMVVFNSIEGYLKKPLQDNGFRITSLSSVMQQMQADAMNKSNSKTKGQVSQQDLMALTAQADIWLSVNLIIEREVSGGQERQFNLSFTGVDPILMLDKINMTPIIKKTSSDNDMVLIENSVNSALDNFIPELANYFSERAKKGLEGKIEFGIAEGVEFDFDTEVSINGEDLTVSALLDGIVSKQAKTHQASGQSTSSMLKFDAVIDLMSVNIISGKTEMNNYKKMSSKIVKDIKELLKDKNVTATAEERGLGKVYIIIKNKEG